jgi:hypothetical protein
MRRIGFKSLRIHKASIGGAVVPARLSRGRSWVQIPYRRQWVVSSGVERLIVNQRVNGSNPLLPSNAPQHIGMRLASKTMHGQGSIPWGCAKLLGGEIGRHTIRSRWRGQSKTVDDQKWPIS